MSLSSDILKARELFETGKYTCVLCRGEEILTSAERGVKPLVDFLENGRDYTGFSAVDKIVGRAAAHLYMLMRVTCIHASVMSRGAYELLTANGINADADIFTDSIINRTGDGICPMEKAVSGVDDSRLAILKIKETMSKLQKSH